MHDDALAPDVASGIILIVHNDWTLVFIGSNFQQPVPFIIIEKLQMKVHVFIVYSILQLKSYFAFPGTVWHYIRNRLIFNECTILDNISCGNSAQLQKK